MRIRLANFSDIEEIYKLNLELENDITSKERLIELYEHGLSFWVIYTNDKTIKGYAIYLICLDELRLLSLVITKKYQNLGLAKNLLTHIINEGIIKHHVRYIILETRINNFKALGLYTSFNFYILGVRKKYYFNPEQDGYLLQLTLDN